ncbi:MAG: GNAT family N-acetyltransferase [Dehalococcoidia bacterium]
MPGFVALLGDTIAGVITLHVVGDACEVVTINSRMDGSGAGTALFAAAISYARDRGCRRLWLITTNDNTDALRFYQRRGMRLTAVHTGAVDAARQQEPEIPRVGRHGSPIHDEIELTIDLDG